jgi:endonuclease YncB( thermonuclease family)
MTQTIHARFGSSRQFGQRIALAAAGFAIGVVVVLVAGGQWRETQPVDTPTVLTMPPPNPSGPTVRTVPTSPSAPTVSPSVITSNIQVVDGDTVRSGAVYRLVGFDAPESGDNARCLHENVLAQRATQRLRQLILDGDVQLTRVPCACRPGTEGTRNCNFGRLCGRLTTRGGRDVAGIMIGEGLARPFVCGPASCPRRQSWCG